MQVSPNIVFREMWLTAVVGRLLLLGWDHCWSWHHWPQQVCGAWPAGGLVCIHQPSPDQEKQDHSDAGLADQSNCLLIAHKISSSDPSIDTRSTGVNTIKGAKQDEWKGIALYYIMVFAIFSKSTCKVLPFYFYKKKYLFHWMISPAHIVHHIIDFYITHIFLHPHLFISMTSKWQIFHLVCTWSKESPSVTNNLS